VVVSRIEEAVTAIPLRAATDSGNVGRCLLEADQPSSNEPTDNVLRDVTAASGNSMGMAVTATASQVTSVKPAVSKLSQRPPLASAVGSRAAKGKR
jgi:hypothetical protein